MADYRYTSQLKKELEQEEALLKSIKDKLVDQLQRLKVEELALVGDMSTSNPSNLSQTASSTGSYFHNTIQGGTNTVTEEINNEINCVPLSGFMSEGLVSNSLILISQPGVSQEEEEEENEEEENDEDET